MSFTGSDDDALCDGECNTMYPPGYPGTFLAVWPVTGPLWDANGRMTADRRDSFHLCLDCLQAMVLRSRLSRDSRELAVLSAARWRASQRLLDQAEDVVKGPRASGRQGAA